MNHGFACGGKYLIVTLPGPYWEVLVATVALLKYSVVPSEKVTITSGRKVPHSALAEEFPLHGETTKVVLARMISVPKLGTKFVVEDIGSKKVNLTCPRLTVVPLDMKGTVTDKNL